MGWFRCGILLLVAAMLTPCQNLLPAQYQKAVDSAMDGGMTADGKLDCNTTQFNPFLDFALRFEAGFVVNCSLAQFEGNPALLAIYIRVTPAEGEKAFFGDRLSLPAIPEAKKPGFQWKHFKGEIEFSGAIGVGIGKYKVETLLVDDHNRVQRKSWSVNVAPRGKEKSVEPAIRPNRISALSVPLWEHTRRSAEAGRRLTVLLDAAPMMPWSLKLRAWDRAFLIGSLSSLLRQSGATEVRVVAFNLDQQRVIFRDDDFENDGFVKLNRALQALELGTVSYHSLQRGTGWADLLVNLVNAEVTGDDSSDAVVFLGPNIRIMDKIDPEALRTRADIGPRLYYFEYFSHFGYEFPDSIHHLTNACRGTVFKMHSAADFAASIAKLQHRLDSDTAAP